MLYALPKDEIKFRGRTLKLNMSFDNILKVFALQKDELFDEVERLTMGLELLLSSPKILRRFKPRLTIQDLAELYATVFRVLVHAGSVQSSAGPRVIDFEYDAEYIYAAFQQAYSINLHQEMGKMHWQVFMALLKGLPGDTRMKEIMDIRAKPFPAATKHNAQEIQALQKAKTFWQIPMSEDEREQAFQQGLDQFVDKLIVKGKADGKDQMPKMQ